MNWTESLQKRVPFYAPPDKGVQVFYGDFGDPFGQNTVIKRIRCTSQAEVQQAKKEAEFTTLCPHPGICKCLDFSTELITEGGVYAYLVFPRMPQSLEDEVKARKARKCAYSETELRAYYSQLLDIFCHLNSITSPTAI